MSDIVASFINTGHMQYCVLPFYFLALCLPLLFCVSIFKFKPNIFFAKARGKAAKTPASRQPAEEFKFQNLKLVCVRHFLPDSELVSII